MMTQYSLYLIMEAFALGAYLNSKAVHRIFKFRIIQTSLVLAAAIVCWLDDDKNWFVVTVSAIYLFIRITYELAHFMLFLDKCIRKDV